MIDVAVGFFTFNRLDTVIQVFDEIRKAKPTRLYLISDGPREEKTGEDKKVFAVRDYIEKHIDWACTLKKNYAEKNMGCKRRMASGISWLFENEESAIILEDDVKPTLDFFCYCKEMLERYKDDERIMHVSGFKIVGEYPVKDSYAFTHFPMIWGWASWRRAWDKYDVNITSWEKRKKDKSLRKYYNLGGYLKAKRDFDSVYMQKKDTWDFQWEYAVLENAGLAVIPKVNLIENLGFGRDDATHTNGKTNQDFTTYPLEFPLMHPDHIGADVQYDKKYLDNGWGIKALFFKGISKMLGVY